MGIYVVEGGIPGSVWRVCFGGIPDIPWHYLVIQAGGGLPSLYWRPWWQVVVVVQVSTRGNLPGIGWWRTVGLVWQWAGNSLLYQAECPVFDSIPWLCELGWASQLQFPSLHQDIPITCRPFPSGSHSLTSSDRWDYPTEAISIYSMDFGRRWPVGNCRSGNSDMLCVLLILCWYSAEYSIVLCITVVLCCVYYWHFLFLMDSVSGKPHSPLFCWRATCLGEWYVESI